MMLLVMPIWASWISSILPVRKQSNMHRPAGWKPLEVGHLLKYRLKINLYKDQAKLYYKVFQINGIKSIQYRSRNCHGTHCLSLFTVRQSRTGLQTHIKNGTDKRPQLSCLQNYECRVCLKFQENEIPCEWCNAHVAATANQLEEIGSSIWPIIDRPDIN